MTRSLAALLNAKVAADADNNCELSIELTALRICPADGCTVLEAESARELPGDPAEQACQQSPACSTASVRQLRSSSDPHPTSLSSDPLAAGTINIPPRAPHGWRKQCRAPTRHSTSDARLHEVIHIFTANSRVDSETFLQKLMLTESEIWALSQNPSFKVGQDEAWERISRVEDRTSAAMSGIDATAVQLHGSVFARQADALRTQRDDVYAEVLEGTRALASEVRKAFAGKPIDASKFYTFVVDLYASEVMVAAKVARDSDSVRAKLGVRRVVEVVDVPDTSESNGTGPGPSDPGASPSSGSKSRRDEGLTDLHDRMVTEMPGIALRVMFDVRNLTVAVFEKISEHMADADALIRAVAERTARDRRRMDLEFVKELRDPGLILGDDLTLEAHGGTGGAGPSAALTRHVRDPTSRSTRSLLSEIALVEESRLVARHAEAQPISIRNWLLNNPYHVCVWVEEQALWNSTKYRRTRVGHPAASS